MWLIFLGAISPRTGSFMVAGWLLRSLCVCGVVVGLGACGGNGRTMRWGVMDLDGRTVGYRSSNFIGDRRRSNRGLKQVQRVHMKVAGTSFDRVIGPCTRCTACLAYPPLVVRGSLAAAKATEAPSCFARLAEGNDDDRPTE